LKFFWDNNGALFLLGLTLTTQQIEPAAIIKL